MTDHKQPPLPRVAAVRPSYVAIQPNRPVEGIAKLGAYLLCAYLFLAYGRIPELLMLKVGVALPIMQVIMLLAMIISVLTGGIFSFLSDRLLLVFGGYYAWTIFCVPFGVWRGGSIPFVLYELRMAVIFIAIISLTQTTGHIYKSMFAIALSMVVLTAISGSVEVDRDRLSFAGGSLANPNELANHLLIGLPLSWAIGMNRKQLSFPGLVRIFVLVASAVMLIKTGSRGGMIVSATLTVALLCAVSWANKMKLVLVGVAIALIAVSAASDAVIARYQTMFGEGDVTNEAVQSKSSRTELLKASLRITAQHPIFGVGPGNFVVAYNNIRHSEGFSGYHWEATHNAYTQLSSEKGVPGVVLYVAVLFIAVKRLFLFRRTVKFRPEFAAQYQIASLLLLSILAFVASGFFTSNAHQFYFPLLAGLAVVTEHYGRQEQEASAVAASAPPAPVAPDVRPTPRQRPLPGISSVKRPRPRFSSNA